MKESVKLNNVSIHIYPCLPHIVKTTLPVFSVHYPWFKEMGSFFVGGKIDNHSDSTFN